MAHQEYEELLTLEALDALEAPDRPKLEAHLESCSVCRAELAEMRDAAGLLAHASTAAAPSAQLRARILDEVSSDRRPTRQAETSKVVDITAKRKASFPWNLMRIAAVLAFAALVFGLLGAWLSANRRIAALTAQVEAQRNDLAQTREVLASQREAIALMNSPGMKKMELAGTQTAQSARATFVYDQNTGRAMLMTNGLPTAPSGMAYEVWFIPKGHSPMPGKTFKVDASGHAMMMDQMPPEAMENAVIAVTLEPEKGSPTPTGAIYLSSPAS